MATQIRKDTVWSGKIKLKSDVQVAPSATLTIEAGTKVDGNNHEIAVFGKIDFKGERFDHIEAIDLFVDFGDSSHEKDPVVKVNYMQMMGGGIFDSTDSIGIGHFDIRNSYFKNILPYMELWYPQSKSKFIGNHFHNVTISANITDQLNFEGNAFSGYESHRDYGYLRDYILSVDGDDTVVFSENYVFDSDGILILTESHDAKISGDGNKFEDIADNELKKHIHDRSDDLSLGRIDIETSKTAQHSSPMVQLGSGESDNLKGTSMDDWLWGRSGADKILGKAGDDEISGGGGNDSLNGNAGKDELMGAAGHDSLDGGVEDDSLEGNKGRDVLIGDGGDDRLVGGAGSDVFVFSKGDGNDTIKDWSDGSDVLQFESGASRFKDLEVSQEGKHAHIMYKDGSIILEKTNIEQISWEDTIFT
jgi:hypothetical protein